MPPPQFLIPNIKQKTLQEEGKRNIEADLSSFNRNGCRNWHLPGDSESWVLGIGDWVQNDTSQSLIPHSYQLRNRSPGLQVVAGGSQGRSLPPSG